MTERKGTSAGRAVLRAIMALVFLAALTSLLFLLDAGGAYVWMKAVHVIAVISWMAGMLYLPRLFVYHADVERGSAQSETFKVMERRLLRAIINPAMLVTWAAGLWLAWHGFGFQAGWLHAKLALVLVMSGVSPRIATKSRRGTGGSSTRCLHC